MFTFCFRSAAPETSFQTHTCFAKTAVRRYSDYSRQIKYHPSTYTKGYLQKFKWAPCFSNINFAELLKKPPLKNYEFNSHNWCTFWDWSGTTSDQGGLSVVDSMRQAFEQEGNVKPTKEQICEGMGGDKLPHLTQITESVKEAWYQMNGKLPTEFDIDRIHEAYKIIQNKNLDNPDYSQPIAGVEESLRRIRELGFYSGSTTGFGNQTSHKIASAFSGFTSGFQFDIMRNSDLVKGTRASGAQIDSALEELSKQKGYLVKPLFKIDDTCEGTLEGHNCTGAHDGHKYIKPFTISVVAHSVFMGLTEAEINQLSTHEFKQRSISIAKKLALGGRPHIILPRSSDVPALLPLLVGLFRRGYTGDEFPIDPTLNPESIIRSYKSLELYSMSKI